VSEQPTMQDPEPREPIRNRPFSKRQTKIAFFTGRLALLARHFRDR